MRQIAPHSIPKDASETDLRRALEEAGWRFTRQRAEVFSYLHRSHSHPTADQVYHAVQRRIPKISLATVYKALEALVGAGLAVKLPDADGPARYDCRTDAHYHFRCLKSGQVHDLPAPFDPGLVEHLDPALIDTLRRQGFHVTGHRLELVGYFTQA
ncbi:MAG: transcriptional repressor [Gemmataceae bacterium]|nr:transcriptional repressor [Gemmataceae bacterium]